MKIIRTRNFLWLLAISCLVPIFYAKHEKLTHNIVLKSVSECPINGTDPIRLSDVYSTQIASRIYEGLYTYHYLKRPLEVIPNLAEGMPTISPDGLVYTCKIKKGVFFQDNTCFPDGKGRELKATDFVFSFKRVVDPSNVVPYADFIDGKIKGLDQWKKSPDYNQAVEGLKALDDYTLQITLTAPCPQFIYVLTMWITYVVPQEAVLHYGDKFKNHPVGTGPFSLPKGFNPQAKQLTFIKNPTFRDCFFPTASAPEYKHMLVYAGKKLPLVDQLITHVITEEQPRWLKIKKGEVDIIPLDEGSAVALAHIKEGNLLPEHLANGLQLDQSTSATTEFFCFNHNHELFGKNDYLRKAMSMAFDRATYRQMFYNDATDLAKSLLPPMMTTNNHNLIAPYDYNIAQAKAYLAKAGYPEGKGLPMITLDTRIETAYKNKADFFAKCMDKIGIKVEVITNVWPEFKNKIFVKQATMMHLITWAADYPEENNMLEGISNKNLFGLQYEDAAFNRHLAKACAEPDLNKRRTLYAQLNQMVAEKVPAIFAVHAPTQFIHRKEVKNFIYTVFNLSSDQYIAIEQVEKPQ
ncbi:MAG: hypothetical protein K2X94_03980 [Amoebophilaceae bacterium]|nr:hypothetical protein [Amoebophilaceae bacterium]